jgi:hypothetical protein
MTENFQKQNLGEVPLSSIRILFTWEIYILKEAYVYLYVHIHVGLCMCACVCVCACIHAYIGKGMGVEAFKNRRGAEECARGRG